MNQSHNKLDIIEIFPSIQGEGLFAGVKQIFVRTAHCNLSCKYCDTKPRYRKKAFIYNCPGKQKKIYYNNPVPSETIIDILFKYLNNGKYHSISFTGNEPLLQADSLANIFHTIKSNTDTDIFLETNGTLPAEFNRIMHYINILSLDIKLPSATGIASQFSKHKKFIDMLTKRKICYYIKCVVTSETNNRELSLLRKLNLPKDIPVILQPAVYKKHFADITYIMQLQQYLLKHFRDVRIIPQIHKLLKIK